jgi:F-type H+-transporting ATPase subunit a
MPEHSSWLNLIPGIKQLFEGIEHGIQAVGPTWFEGRLVTAQHIGSILLVATVMLLLSWTARRQLERSGSDILPETRLSARTLVEMLLEGILALMQFAMPYEAALRHFRVIGTLGFFILFSNLLGMIPGFVPPTENWNTTLACATVVFVYYNFYAFLKLGMGHIAHMANPVGEPWGWFLAPLFLPIELISHCIRPMSLSVRLLCNIAGDHLVLGVFVGIFPLILPLPFLALGLFVALVQTFVFCLLSCVYIGEVEAIVAHHQHHEDHGHAAEPAASHAITGQATAHES